MQPYLEHIIRETGHRHCAALEEVHPETLDYLRPCYGKPSTQARPCSCHALLGISTPKRSTGDCVCRCGGA